MIYKVMDWIDELFHDDLRGWRDWIELHSERATFERLEEAWFLSEVEAAESEQRLRELTAYMYARTPNNKIWTELEQHLKALKPNTSLTPVPEGFGSKQNQNKKQ